MDDGAWHGDRRAAEPSLIAVVAADHERRRGRIVAALARDGVLTATSSRRPGELVERCLSDPPDVAVMWATLTARALATAVVHMRRSLAAVRIVVVAGSGDRRAVQRVIGAGANGAVWEIGLETALAPTVRAVCAGQVAVPGELRGHVARAPLSHREKQVVGMAMTGLTNAEIAGTLALTDSTVKSHLSRAFGKLGVRSREAAAELLFEPHDEDGPGPGAAGDRFAVSPPPTGAR